MNTLPDRLTESEHPKPPSFIEKIDLPKYTGENDTKKIQKTIHDKVLMKHGIFDGREITPHLAIDLLAQECVKDKSEIKELIPEILYAQSVSLTELEDDGGPEFMRIRIVLDGNYCGVLTLTMDGRLNLNAK